MTLPTVNLQFITSNVFPTKVWVMQEKTCLTGEVLFWFNFCFVFFMLGISGEIDSSKNLPCFFSICAIAPLIICFDLSSRKMFSKIKISLLYYISVFIILLQISLLFNFLSVLHNLTSVKVLMISRCPTIVWVLLPLILKEYNHLKSD